MAEIIQFTPRPRRQRRLEEAPRVLLFLGVQYERWSEENDETARKRVSTPSKSRGSRKRA